MSEESDLATAVDFALGYRGTAEEDEYMARLSKALGAYRSSPPAETGAEIRRLRAEVERLCAVQHDLIVACEMAYSILHRDGITPLRGEAFNDTEVERIHDAIQRAAAAKDGGE